MTRCRVPVMVTLSLTLSPIKELTRFPRSLQFRLYRWPTSLTIPLALFMVLVQVMTNRCLLSFKCGVPPLVSLTRVVVWLVGDVLGTNGPLPKRLLTLPYVRGRETVPVRLAVLRKLLSSLLARGLTVLVGSLRTVRTLPLVLVRARLEPLSRFLLSLPQLGLHSAQLQLALDARTHRQLLSLRWQVVLRGVLVRLSALLLVTAKFRVRVVLPAFRDILLADPKLVLTRARSTVPMSLATLRRRLGDSPENMSLGLGRLVVRLSGVVRGRLRRVRCLPRSRVRRLLTAATSLRVAAWTALREVPSLPKLPLES